MADAELLERLEFFQQELQGTAPHSSIRPLGHQGSAHWLSLESELSVRNDQHRMKILIDDLDNDRA
jgi:hypothetical protein